MQRTRSAAAFKMTSYARALAVSSLVPVPASGAEKETLARAETRDLPFGPFESSE